MLINVTLPVLLTLPEKVSNWPGNDRSGHTLVTLMPGVVFSLQMADAVFVAMACVQMSLPVAITVLLTEHAPAVAVKLAVKIADAPGVSVIGPMTGVLGAGWLFTTNTLFSVTLPGLLTVPV